MERNGGHFAFGENWRGYLRTVDEKRVEAAVASLRGILKQEDLSGRSFLDIGCGSGLFSLAAVRLGARKVHSFDRDPHSVDAARTLKALFAPDSGNWSIEQGDILDGGYLSSLGRFDIVYSWGVLHHTGALWEALKTAASAVRGAGGTMVIALYNDQGRRSCYWKAVKKAYNLLPGAARPLILLPAFCRIWGPSLLRDLLRGEPLKTWDNYRENRGMSPWHDVVDWVGGYPFEVAKPAEVIGFCRENGFVLRRVNLCGKGCGNNEYVFVKA